MRFLNLEQRAALEHLEKNGVYELLHFTSIENLEQIIRSGGLRSKQDMEGRIFQWPKEPGGTLESQEKDRKYGTWDMVPLSFTHRTPMAYWLKREMHLCCFAINPTVIFNAGAMVTTTNSASGARHIPAPEGIYDVKYWAFRASYRDRYAESWKRDVQAEVLVPERIDFDDIFHVGFVSEASLEEGEGLSENYGFLDFIVEPHYFSDSPIATKIGFPYLEEIEESDALYTTVCQAKAGTKMHFIFTKDSYKFDEKLLPWLPSIETDLPQSSKQKIFVHRDDIPADSKLVTIYLESGPNKVRWTTFPLESPNQAQVDPSPEDPNTKSPRANSPEHNLAQEKCPALKDRFLGALALCSAGDALGWATEFLDPNTNKRLSFSLPLQDFVHWTKSTGGGWWGYSLNVRAGEYSDDTQLNLAVSRCISNTGNFLPELFAYRELPLWLQYEYGGGRSIKLAANSLISKSADWSRNFYKKGSLNYFGAGGNGAAMRNLPISLVGVNNIDRMHRDSIYNSIITHGHPHGILGTTIMACSTRHALLGNDPCQLIDCLRSGLETAEQYFQADRLLIEWAKCWEKRAGRSEGDFLSLLSKSKEQAHYYLVEATKFRNKEHLEYYGHIGALDPATKGSGIVSACAAVFLTLKEFDDPHEPVLAAANMLGSDTDTIAAFAGSILGARYGMESIPKAWREQLQDFEHIGNTATRLHAITEDNTNVQMQDSSSTEPEDSYRRILEWEKNEYCRMFDGSVEVNTNITHPTLGVGTISEIASLECARQGYSAKAIRVAFDCGQSCTFHSRILQHASSSLFQSVSKAVRN